MSVVEFFLYAPGYLNSKEFNNNGSFTILQFRDCSYQLLPSARGIATMSEVATVLILLIVMAATNALSEKTASDLRKMS